MTNREKTESCPLCDSQNTEVRFDRERRFKYLKKERILTGLEHTICIDCGCSFNAKGQIQRNNERFFEFEQSVLDGIISPRKIVELRQTYNLTQEQAKRIFKTTGNLFSKWERGESAPSSAVSNLLLAALEDAVIMKRMALRAGVKNIELPSQAHDSETAQSFFAYFSTARSRSEGVSEPLSVVGASMGVTSPVGKWTQYFQDGALVGQLRAITAHEVDLEVSEREEDFDYRSIPPHLLARAGSGCR